MDKWLAWLVGGGNVLFCMFGYGLWVRVADWM